MRKKVLLTVALLLFASFAVVTPNQANAAATYSLLKTSTLSSNPAEGWSSCQSKYVTLPALPSSSKYGWSEEFQAQDGLEAYNQTFAGTYYWSVCLASMTGISSNWTYAEYSLLTLDNATCKNTGHCTEYELQTHYLRQDATATGQWGSLLQVLPSNYCVVVLCIPDAKVLVTHT